jgi:hypothetical protein
MTKPPDLETLARRYFDLWQAQIAVMAGDPKLNDSLSRLFALMSGGGAAAFTGATEGGAATPAAAESPAAAEPAAAELERLRGRVDALERRLAALEAAAAPQRPAKSARRPSSRRRPLREDADEA